MIIKNATTGDKKQVLGFCKNTFSWGDYIDLVWDYWINEDNLLCVFDRNVPIGICHVSISDHASQVWIEGIRIHPQFRRKHLATKLISVSESIGIKNFCNTSYMLIENNNIGSLALAKNLNYIIDETWNFYSVQNLLNASHTDARLVTSTKELSDFTCGSFKFVKSWRWLPLTAQFLDGLLSDGHVLFSKVDDVISLATMIPSEHFDNTLLVTILSGNKSGINEIIKFVQNYGLQNNIVRIQLLVNDNVVFENNSVEKRLVFNLMKKNLLK